VHWKNGLFVTTNGIEVPLLYASATAAITLIGPGAYSFDEVLGLAPAWSPTLKLLAVAFGLAGGAANLMIRRPVPQPGPPS